MLQIEGIRKVYKTGNLVQEALKGVSLSLRDNEFVAILGQSGSGKTTLLNIIGGLDRYDDGNLIINGVSTKRYSDRDWDSYRNHTVGFVFQSYNLIPHQTVLKNVELALTISGISAGDRTARATEALEKVGLSEHIHKKPSQLSGGQMQRVAIARALVNDPDILLADEPTGALDSDTSIQVMDLLKEVAQDRLVVMVTHNPELAERYATRIVTLKDGEITSDSDPYTPAETEAVHKNLGKSSMSLLTSMALSFNNLWTKKARTILVAFAGSIGIIGIAMILAMSNGANEYIRSVEEGSLQDYPLQITDTSFSMVSMFAGGMSPSAKATEATPDDKVVEEWRTVTNIISGMNTNDLKSLKAYFESDECDINDHVQTIEYDYNITPRIYKENDDGGFRQVNPSTTFASLGFGGSESSTNGLFSAFSNTDSFFVMPEKDEVYQKSFDLKAGKWPENHNECIVTLTANGRVSDLVLYIMGLKDPKELTKMIDAFSQGESVNDISEFNQTTKTETTLPVSKFPINETVPVYTAKTKARDITSRFTGLPLDKNYNHFGYTINDQRKKEGSPRALVFQGSYMNSYGHKYYENAFGECVQVHNYQNVLNLPLYYNIFNPQVVVFELAEYTLKSAYFDFDKVKNISFNPELKSLKGTFEAPKSLSYDAVSIEKNKDARYTTITWKADEDPQYVWLVLEKAYDMQKGSDGTYSVIVPTAEIDKENVGVKIKAYVNNDIYVYS